MTHARQLHRFGSLLLSVCFSAVLPAQVPTAAPAPQVNTNVSVAMRDGTTLSVDIYRPAGGGTLPTLYAAGPYAHDTDTTAPDTPETGPVAWLVNQGFNYVLASVRGTGDSGGEYGFMSRDEQQDHYELIEWIAAQDWSDGKVAGIGAGYYGTAQWHMAVQNPPHLACVAPMDGLIDPYRDWASPGGVQHPGFITWYEQQVRDAHAFPARGPARHIAFDLRLELLRHPLLDAFWQLRSASTNFPLITTPVYAVADWQVQPAGHSSLLRNFSRLPATARLYIGEHPARLQDRALLENELLPFYRWCLGDPSVAGPHLAKHRYRLAVQGENQVTGLADWPAASVRFQALHLQPVSSGNGAAVDAAGGALGVDVAAGGRRSTAYGTGHDHLSLTFTSPELAEDLTLLGPLLLELHASSSASDTGFHVELYEEVVRRRLPETAPAELPTFLDPRPEPGIQALVARTLLPVSEGWLKASVGSQSTALGPDMQPERLFDVSRPISARSVLRHDIALQPVARRFRAGNRIVLRITQASDPALRRLVREDTIFHDMQYQSRLHLPVLPNPAKALTAPFAPFADSVPVPASVRPPAAATEEALDTRNLFDSTNPVILVPRREEFR